VRALQCAGKRKDQGYVFLLGVIDAGDTDGGRGARGQAAG
jgi:hypothetical protein